MSLGGCAVALVPRDVAAPDRPSVDRAEARALEPTSRWTISIRPDTEDEPTKVAPSLEVARDEAEAPPSPRPVEVAIARPPAPPPVVPTAEDLPSYVSPRSTALVVEPRPGYVIEPPAHGGGEPRDPADVTAADLLDPEYRIGVEDLLDVSVLGESDLQHLVLRVSPRGTVDFPYAGTLTAAGLTVDELRTGLVEKLAEYYVAPQLTVFLREYRSRMVHVLGEVPRPGPFKLTHRNTLMEVLSRAGGFTPLASRGDVQVIRQDSAGKRVIHVDVNEIIDDGRLELDIPLESGDVIHVPERIF